MSPAQRPAPGDFFGIPLPNGSMALGQILSVETEALNSVGCALFGDLVPVPFALPTDLAAVSVLLVTPDLLRRGTWPILGNGTAAVPPESRPYESFRSNGWVGAKIMGSAIVGEFMAAFHGLWSWDEWADPAYLDKLLLPGVPRPTIVRLRSPRP